MEQTFSVTMSVYAKDDPAHFQAAVDSLLHQTRRPDEIVLVVDGPVPEALTQIISALESLPGVQVLRLKENQGHGNARRLGLCRCSNELVAIMDADDLCVPERFALQLDYFSRHPECDVLGGQIEEFVHDPAQPVGKRVVPLEHDALMQYLKKRCPFNQVTVMLRKKAAQDAGGYLDWYCDEDYYLWARMALSGAVFANLPQTLVQVRVGEEMYRRRGGRKYFSSEARLQRYMLQKKLISLPRYIVNVTKRFIVQLMLPNCLRSWVFRHFARE